MKTKKHVEVWPDETSNGRWDSMWIVSIESNGTSTTKYIEADYMVAEQLAIDLGAELGLKVIGRNRFGEVYNLTSAMRARR